MHRLAEHLQRVDHSLAESAALLWEGTWWTWSDLHHVGVSVLEASASMAHSRSWARVGILARNRPGIAATILTVLARGACIVIFDPLDGATQVAADAAANQVDLVVMSLDDFRRLDDGGSLEHIGAEVVVAPDISAGNPDRVLRRTCSANPDNRGRHDDAAVSMRTSGTTGRPKRVEISWDELDHSLGGARRQLGHDWPPQVQARAGTVPIVMPISHHSGLVYGLLLPLLEGRRVALMDRFEPTRWAEVVRDNEVVLSALPPAALRMILDADVPTAWLASLRAVRCGTAPLDTQTTIEFERRYDVAVLRAYGSTELGGVTSFTLADHRTFASTKAGTVGRANPGVELKIVDARTRDAVPAGVEGQLLVRIIGRGPDWVATNDRATLDDDGFLYIGGRLDDVIIRGGLKIAPGEVESALRSHPRVRDVAIVGIPDERLGQVPAGLVVVETGTDTQELLSWVRERVGPYRTPAVLLTVPALPRTNSLKVATKEVERVLTESRRLSEPD
jgi:long-chain acyl-CoA synthetase